MDKVVNQNETGALASLLSENFSTDASARPGKWAIIHDNAVDAAGASNWASSRRFDILNALERMSQLSEDDDYFLKSEVRQRAAEILNYLVDNFKIEPPKILPEDEETVSFTWELGHIKQYLSIDPFNYDVLHLNTGSNLRCENTIGRETNSIDELTRVLLVEAKSSAAEGF